MRRGRELNTETVIAIDPGSEKCGLAVVSGPVVPHPRQMRVVETERLVAEVSAILVRFPDITHILIGDGTTSATLRRALRAGFPETKLTVVPEAHSSERGRKRFIEKNPATGWRKLLPAGLRSPERPYDDYVALLLAEDYFSAKKGKTP